jgi:NAD-dependent deacetylase
VIPDADLRRAAALFGRACSILFVTGAGISADSGLPTYRGIGGLYDRETTEEGFPIEVALSGEMLRRNPGICWKYIAEIEAACRGARFNRAHEIVAELEREKERVCVLTQNVDGFHRAAGSENVIAIHGDIHDLRCIGCDGTWRVADFAGLSIPPRCEHCGACLRPGVVLFGELLPPGEVEALERELRRGFDLVVSIGTSSVFPYIAGPVVDAARRGIPTIEIDPGETEISGFVELRIREGARVALERIRGAMT